MAKMFQAIRGMNDTLPQQTPYWQHVESICRRVVAAYGYREIRFPLIESTALFSRSIGDITDIVEKEMYTFADRNGASLTLRPEGTAGCVRAAIEHGLLHNQMQRLWYLGAMFRHERPQRGRYRQFYQLGVEAYGMDGPDIDVEMILLSSRLFAALGLSDKVVLQLNTLGSQQARLHYREKLLAYFSSHLDVLDQDSRHRLSSNPLRILDSKNPAMAEVIAEAPKMLDCLDDASKKHFDDLCEHLEALKQPFVINPTLVRGLDYYCLTVFEWVTSELGAQGTVCAGGRYNTLVGLLGGKPTPAIGFSVGLERAILLLELVKQCQQSPDVFMILSEKAVRPGLQLAEQLRNELSGLAVESNFGAASMKAQFKRAINSGARWVITIGDDELSAKCVSVNDLSVQQPAQTVSFEQLVQWLQSKERA